MCSRCRFYRLDPANKMTAQGFGLCTHLDVWHYRSGRAACYFDPSRFEARPA